MDSYIQQAIDEVALKLGVPSLAVIAEVGPETAYSKSSGLWTKLQPVRSRLDFTSTGLRSRFPDFLPFAFHGTEDGRQGSVVIDAEVFGKLNANEQQFGLAFSLTYAQEADKQRSSAALISLGLVVVFAIVLVRGSETSLLFAGAAQGVFLFYCHLQMRDVIRTSAASAEVFVEESVTGTHFFSKLNEIHPPNHLGRNWRLAVLKTLRRSNK